MPECEFGPLVRHHAQAAMEGHLYRCPNLRFPRACSARWLAAMEGHLYRCPNARSR